MTQSTPGDLPVGVEPLDGGGCWRVVFGIGKGNLLDRATVAALTDAFREAGQARELRALCLEGRGPHFSFGASVQEHLPEQVAEMLQGFHALFRALLDSSVVVLAAVRGSCLGGGLELASACTRVFAAPDARLGQPEIRLGVFAPVGSLMLAERVGRRHAEDLLLSGRTLDAGQALALGLVDAVAADPTEAAHAYAREHLLPLSASSLRYAVRAARLALRARFEGELQRLERLYLEELMGTSDAVEGLRAFLDKRRPEWRHA